MDIRLHDIGRKQRANRKFPSYFKKCMALLYASKKNSGQYTKKATCNILWVSA